MPSLHRKKLPMSFLFAQTHFFTGSKMSCNNVGLVIFIFNPDTTKFPGEEIDKGIILRIFILNMIPQSLPYVFAGLVKQAIGYLSFKIRTYLDIIMEIGIKVKIMVGI